MRWPTCWSPPKLETRDVLLIATGHAYWPTMTVGALVLGVGSALATVFRHFVRGLRRAPWRAGEERLGRLVVRLALLQVGIRAPPRPVAVALS
jgi:hypothetical protein